MKTSLKTYVVWVIRGNGRGTAHVSSHRASSPEGAAKQALWETHYDWDLWPRSDLRVLGIAEGDVKLVEWNDLDE